MRRTTGARKVATVRQLEVMMQAGIEAARTGSQDSSNVTRRINAAIRRKALELRVQEPDLTAKVKEHMKRLAAGHADLLPDPSVSDEKLALATLLEQESDFTDSKRLDAANRDAYRDLEESLPPPPQPTADSKRSRNPNDKRNLASHGKPKPPLAEKGRGPCATGTEAERRVHEIVRRMGLGATRRQIITWAQENWGSGTSERNVDEYIASARAVLRANWHRDREDFMVDLLEQYQRLSSDARAADQLNTALGCLNSMAKLANMGGFSSTQAQ